VIEWFAWTQVGIASAAGLIAFGYALKKSGPNDYTLGLSLLVGVLLVVQVVISIVAPFVGMEPTGDALEYWMYLITAVLMVPAAIIWALVERSVVSNIILGVVGLSIAVMVARMHQIWFVQSA
jgi:hypothetical protein